MSPQSLISLNLIIKNHTHIWSLGITDALIIKGINSKTFVRSKTNQGCIVASKLSSHNHKILLKVFMTVSSFIIE